MSGFYGDRFDAPREMVEGPEPIDVLTGDYLAELTMLILWKARRKDPSAGYATTFLRQMEGVLGTCLDKGVKVVANAGGLNPHGLAEQLHSLAARLTLSPRIAVVEGDDVVPLFDGDGVVTANAYLGGWGVTEGLRAGADIVVTPRIADAALVSGPAAWWHGWTARDWDRLAGAVAAGHVIECGPQATGGNYAFAEELPDAGPPGYPIAEVASDGSSVITKQPGTPGAVTVGTVTSQLLYEIADPAYATADVVAHFDSVDVTQEAPDRVRITGAVGSPAPCTLKVALTLPGGWRNQMTLVVPGLDREAKAARAMAQLKPIVDKVDELRTDWFEAADVSLLRIAVKDRDKDKVGRRFSNAVTELLLATYAGAFTTTPPADASEYGVFRAAYVPAGKVEHAVVLSDGTRRVIAHPTGDESTSTFDSGARRAPGCPPGGPTRAVPLGRVCGARSGDKGGNANVGLWCTTDDAWAWLTSTLTVERFRKLVPEAASLDIRRFELRNLRALNFVVVGLLGDGAASTTRFDAQAKGLGEYVRARVVEVPEALLR